MSKAGAWHALPDLRKLWYKFQSTHHINHIYGRKRAPFYYHMATTQGVKRVKVHARSFQPGHRYMMGVTYGLFDVVDEYVFWFKNEPFVYIFPASFLRDLWKQMGEKRSPEGQWVININVLRSRIDEARDVNIDPFRHWIPTDTQVRELAADVARDGAN